MGKQQGNTPNGSAAIAGQVGDNLEILRQVEALNKRINNDFTGYLNERRDLAKLDKERLALEEDLAVATIDSNNELIITLTKQLALHDRILEAKRQALKNTSLMAMSYKVLAKSSKTFFAGSITNMLKFINDADKGFKSLNLEMGLSGDRSGILLNNLIGASEYSARMGVSFTELAQMQGKYSDEMGRAVVLSEANLKNIVDIGKGTTMGTEMAATMAAKMDLIGLSVEKTKNFYEGAINSSSKYGVNANVVIKKINDNLDKSQGYVFKGGINGLKKMSEFSTKFKVDMSSVFNAMDKANGLEGAVDMAAQLQVIGGKFAQQDPFKLLHQARTDTEGFTKTMQGLTKGMATYNKNSGEFEIQAGDLNRLKLAADATGMSYEELIKQAKQGTKMDSIMDKLSGTGLSKEAKEFVQGVAEIQKDGSFKIQIPGGELKDIKSISESQINAMKNSATSLEQRAKESQAFDEIWNNTINELKSAALPILKVVNSMTTWIASNGGLSTALVGIAGAIYALPGIITSLGAITATVTALKGMSIFGGAGKGAASATSAVTNSLTPDGGKGGGNMNKINSFAPTQQAIKSMLAFGAAVLMVGGGIWLATKGIAAMAEAFKSLSPDQLKELNKTLVVLGGSLAVLTIIGAALAPAVGPMLGFGAAILMIGAGVGIAAVGIGYMAKGLGSMFESLAKVTDPTLISGLSSLVLSMAGLGLASMALANPLAWVGLKVLSSTIGSVAEKISGANFSSLGIASTHLSAIATAINSINETKLDKLIQVSKALSGVGGLATAIASLSNIFGNNAIEVKFKDDKINLQLDVTANMDGEKVSSMLSKNVALQIERAKRGSVR